MKSRITGLVNGLGGILMSLSARVHKFGCQLRFATEEDVNLLNKLDAFIAGFGLNNDGLAQVGHFHVTAFWSLVGYVVGWAFGFWWLGLLVGGLICIPWGIWKEVFRDPKPPENAPFFWNGAKDLAFYWAGWAAATYVASAVGMAFPR